jgi:hypothetical protein
VPSSLDKNGSVSWTSLCDLRSVICRETQMLDGLFSSSVFYKLCDIQKADDNEDKNAR